MLIKNSKLGREDGGYSRLFGNKKLGALISRVHSTTISAGTELERMVQNRAKTLDDLEEFLLGKLPSGTYLIPKKIIKKSSLKTKQEPDFLIIKVDKKHCYIIELKDGDTFDTKKVAGERQSLIEFLNQISQKTPYSYSIHICSFNQSDRNEISKGMKGAFKLEEILTGQEFCDLLNINYREIVETRQKDQKENLSFFLSDIKKTFGRWAITATLNSPAKF